LTTLDYNARSTADQVIAGIDLSGRHIVVTGCNSGLGFETMSSLGANGALVFGVARSLESARAACRRAGPTCTPIAADLSDLGSVAAAVASIRATGAPLDAIVANAGIAELPSLQTRYGVEMQFLVNCVGHFALLDGLSATIRDGAGRIVIVSGPAGRAHSAVNGPSLGIDFDNLDGAQSYHPARFYAQSKGALTLLAREFARRLAGRGIAVNSVDPGRTRGTGIDRHQSRSAWRTLARLFLRNAQRGAATQTLLAASPAVRGVTGQHWADCRIGPSDVAENDAELGSRLWEICQRIVATGAEAAAAPNARPEVPIAAAA